MFIRDGIGSCINCDMVSSSLDTNMNPYSTRRSRNRYVATPKRRQLKPNSYLCSKLPVRRVLNYDPPLKTYKRKYIEEIQTGTGYSMQNNGCYTSFLSYPSLGVGSEGRTTDHIKLLNLSISGTIQVTGDVGDGIVPIMPFNGVFVMAIICDMKPGLPDNSIKLPEFKEFFVGYDNVYGMIRLKENIRYRYRLIGVVKKYIKCDGGHLQLPFKFRSQISSKRYPIWAAFKDAEPSNCGGNYRNISKNALLCSCAWVSLSGSTCDVYSHFMLNYVG
uniref:Nuclear shuttle protein n=1 Tax=Pepper yellow vein Mali virus TaxID=260378 RepID=A0A5B8G6G7_9GEMI|nr:nuclear shuttle protein [Pepper yellow vein Mali virus]QDQ68955.1 nuclear shuttle protein [Pepper yellow vein Mali virus]